MVLEEATDSDPTGQGSDFQQDTMPRESQAGPGQFFIDMDNERYVVNTAALPKPFPFIKSQDWGERPELAQAIGITLVQARKLVDRPLKQGEVDAMAQTFAKSMQLMSWTTPTSLGAAAFMAYRGRTEHRVPFLALAKREWFNPAKLGPFRGATATTMWHMIRFGAWQGWCIALAGLFFGSMARTSTMNAIMTDPRMQAVRDARAKAMDRGGRMLPEPKGPRQVSSIETQEGRMDEQAVRAKDMWQRRRGKQQASSEDDMSPTGGAFAEELSSGGEDRMLSDRDIQANETRQQRDRAAQQQSTQSQDRPQSQPQRPQQATPPAQSSGSAWERVRREAAGQSRSAAPAGRQPTSQRGDDYTFSQQTEDRQLAHGEAQREFDARVERERRGDNFDSGKKGDSFW